MDSINQKKVFEDSFRSATNLAPAMKRKLDNMNMAKADKEDKGYELKPGEILDVRKLK